jgi:hypothetical protein
MLNTATLVPQFLPLAIVLDRFRMLDSVLARVIGMGLAPFLPAIAHQFDILGIILQLLPVVIPPALALAVRLATNSLLRTIQGAKKRLLTVGTPLG